MDVKELSSKDDFQAAISSTDKFVFLIFYENEMPAEAKEKFAANSDKHAAVSIPYVVDIAKSPAAKEFHKIEKTPTVIIFKGGEEVKRIEEPSPETEKEVLRMMYGDAAPPA